MTVAVLGGAVAAGFLFNSAKDSDADGFAAAGRVLLSPHWAQLAVNGAPHSSQNSASAALGF